MSVELYLRRFGPSGGEQPEGSSILAGLISVAERVIGEENSQADIEIIKDEEGFTLDLPSGTAKVSSAGGSFPAGEMDKITVRLAFEIAKAGGMVIITEGGKYQAILTDPQQWNTLPAGWIKDRSQAPVCHSAGELQTLLTDWLNAHRRYVGQMRRDLNKRDANHPFNRIAGTHKDVQREFIYIQARPGETALKHLRAASKHYRGMVKSGVGNFPKTGMLGGTAWRLETPTGDAFYALQVSGDKEAWLSLLRRYASSESRSVGQIVDADRFVLDDGQRFPLSACTCTKVKE